MIPDPTKIEPCPACGNHQTRLFPVVTPGDYRFVECMNCGATGSHHPSEDQAMASWNRLSQAAQLLKAVERLESGDSFTCVHRWDDWSMRRQPIQVEGATLAAALIALAAEVQS